MVGFDVSMSILSDVQDLYGSAQSTWAKSQAHVFSHIVLVIVLFLVCGVTVPEIQVPKIGAAQIADNAWFKLAKDTGIIYVCLVIPIVLAAAYGGLLRIVGQWLTALLALLRPPNTRLIEPRIVNVSVLEPLALVLEKRDFEIHDLVNESGTLAMRYQSKKSEQWEQYQRGLSNLTKNSSIYLGDFLVFLVGWVLVFHFFPQWTWVHQNRSKYWPVLVILFALSWFVWFRVSRVLAIMPSLFLVYVSALVRTDPDMAARLEPSEDTRTAVYERLEKLLRDEQVRNNQVPSLHKYLAHRLGMGNSSRIGTSDEFRGWPLHSVYVTGRRFAWDDKQVSNYDDEWLKRYWAYLYFKIYDRIEIIGKLIFSLIRRIVTGTP